ncbi:DUF2924 domain-containing protein [soil metagenome]
MTLEAEVLALEAMDLHQLRVEWRRRFGAPPKLRSTDMVRYGLAWRIQTAAEGGIPPGLRKRLRGTGGPVDSFDAGVRIAREWQGVRHEVEMVEGGYLYDGRRWKSLSEIAREITGSRWTGPRFFGLRKEALK